MLTEVYLTPPEAAEYLRTSVSTMAKMRCHGGGPAFTRIGRAIRYRRADLDNYMAAQLLHTTSEKRVALDQQVRDDAQVSS
jgi:excisionase family DNA binding protein